jgi:hypothetical protein
VRESVFHYHGVRGNGGCVRFMTLLSIYEREYAGSRSASTNANEAPRKSIDMGEKKVKSPIRRPLPRHLKAPKQPAKRKHPRPLWWAHWAWQRKGRPLQQHLQARRQKHNSMSTFWNARIQQRSNQRRATRVTWARGT